MRALAIWEAAMSRISGITLVILFQRAFAVREWREPAK
jgi:hypothetical protein